MIIRTHEFTASLTDAVVQFNERICRGGGRLCFPASPIPAWLPLLPGRKLYQEFFLALDNEAAVRGGYIIKHRPFSIFGDALDVCDFQLPISEGSVDRKYVAVAVRLLLDALERQPRLFALGMGGFEHALPRLLKAASWDMFSVPFYFRIIRPFPFLRNISYLRKQPLLRALTDSLAFSGLGWAAIKSMHAIHVNRIASDHRISVETVSEFQEWTDELWQANCDQYGLCAVRDCTSLKILYPADEPKFIRLKIMESGRPIGWVVLLNSLLSNHKQFGNMRLGSIVDCFSALADADRVVICAELTWKVRASI